MEWTKEAPTKPGWYWNKSYDSNKNIRIYMTKVDWYYKELRVAYPGNELLFRIDFWKDDLWYGPVEPPA